jgi:hypothetical protein
MDPADPGATTTNLIPKSPTTTIDAGPLALACPLHQDELVATVSTSRTRTNPPREPKTTNRCSSRGTPIRRQRHHYEPQMVAVGTALRSGRDDLSTPPRAAPRADPSVRDYRTGLLPWVMAANRCSGQGCRIRGRGSHCSARRSIRSQLSRCFWLRRRSALSQCRMSR